LNVQVKIYSWFRKSSLEESQFKNYLFVKNS
jgi:hypothetical protein